MILRYVYVSTARRPMLPEDLRDIASSATRHNGRSAITGLLLYGSMNFIQLVEGPIKLLPLTYSRIIEDPRHRDIELLVRDRVKERLFPNWQMGVVSLEDVNRLDRGLLTMELAAVCNKDAGEQERSERAMNLLRRFKSQVLAEQSVQANWKLKPSG